MNPQHQGQAAQGQVRVNLLRPEQIRTIAYLTPEDKTKYEEGLRTLWARMDQNGPETQIHQSAREKILDFSRMIVTKVQTIRARSQQGPQGQAGQSSQQGQPNPQQHVSQSEQPHNVMAATQKAAAMQAMRSQGAGPSNNAMNSGQGAAPANPQPPHVPKHIQEHVDKLPWAILKPPAQLSQEQIPKWVGEMRTRYLRFLVSMESIKSRNAKIDAMLKDRKEKGQQISQDDLLKLQRQRQEDNKNYGDAQRFVDNVRKQMSASASERTSNAGQSGQQARSQPMQPQNTNTTSAASHPMQAATASVNAAMDAAKNQVVAARATATAGQTGQSQPQVQTRQPSQGQVQVQPQPQQQPQPQSQSQLPGTPATPATPSATLQHGQQQPQQPQATPIPAPQPQIKTEPTNTNSMPHPPPVNTALAAAASSAHLPSAGTPTQGSTRIQTPQSAQAPVRPLTHAAAVNRANSSTNVTGHANNSSGNLTTTPGATGLVPNSNHAAHSHAHPQPNTPALNPKMPINKTLPPKATETPTAVNVGGGVNGGRPSYGGGAATGGGVMSQPVIAKMPAPMFDADSEHVLSKKKLDELVRQVCGGASPGADGNYLTPDVEEVSSCHCLVNFYTPPFDS